MSAAPKKVVLEGFVTGSDASWRIDVSNTLDGDERSSMTPLFKIFEREFGHLCSYPDPLHWDGRYMQFGAFRITIEAIEHPRNDAYRNRAAQLGEGEKPVG